MYLGASLCCAALAPLLAQRTSEVGRVVGTVRDSASGRPLANALVVIIPNESGLQYTDSLGRFSINWIRPGVVNFKMVCPSRMPTGRTLLAKPLRVFANDSVVMVVRVDQTLCEEPSYREVRGQVRGFYSSGFEESRLVLCADSMLGIPGIPDMPDWSDQTAWVRFSPEGLVDWNLPRPVSASDSARALDLGGRGKIYVRWEGLLRGPGRFGHMGASPYEVTVEKTLYRGVGDGSVCSRPPDGKR